MKDPTLEQVLEILESQKLQLDKLEKQVGLLSKSGNDTGETEIKTSDIKDNSATENIKLKEKVSAYEERIQDLEEIVGDMKGEMLELMFVYQDIQDKLFDIDRSWQNTLVFYGVKQESTCGYESSECTEAKVREILKTVLNIRREIQFLRVLRVYNGPDVRTGYRPVIACFSKWSDKEEVLRKNPLLKLKGIQAEEDLSRAAKSRRKELEKLMKSIKIREPERRCFLTYDRLVVDDNVYIFNDLEGRVEKLPHKANLSSSSMDLTTITDAYNDVEYNFRKQGSTNSIKKGVSVESQLDKIPLTDQSEPCVDQSARVSLGSVLENTPLDQASSRPGSRRESGTTRPSTRNKSRPSSRASSSEKK